MYILFEKGTTGRVCYISNRYSKASIKSHDPRQESKYVIYLDDNTSSGYAMSKFLPANEFKWVDPKGLSLTNLDILEFVFFN